MNSRTATVRSHANRWGVLAGLVAGVLAVAAWPLSAAHASEGHQRTVPVFAHFQDDGNASPSSISCPNGQAIRGDATFGAQVGDTWRGASVYDLCLVPTSTPGAFTFSGVETFTGTVDGCGTGSISYNLTNGFVQLEPDPTTPNGYQTWTIVAGAGNGDLTDVTAGRGLAIFTIQQTLANEGYFAGYLTC